MRGRNMLKWLISNKLSRINLCISLVYFLSLHTDIICKPLLTEVRYNYVCDNFYSEISVPNWCTFQITWQQNYIHSGCAGLEDVQRLVQLQKSLAETCSQVSILKSQTLRGRISNSQRCNRPLHVLDMSREWIPLTSEVRYCILIHCWWLFLNVRYFYYYNYHHHHCHILESHYSVPCRCTVI